MGTKKKALITGIAGFAGSYLAGHLLDNGYDVYGILAPGEKKDNIRPFEERLHLERFDILKPTRLAKMIKATTPDYIFHLAAFSSVGRSFENERLSYNINFFGTLNVFEAAVSLKSSLKKLVFISSADIYGTFTPKGKTLTEKQPYNPLSPYGISKVAGELLARHYHRNKAIPIVIIRSFNHTGPGQTDTFVVPSFCRQIALIERGRVKSIMRVGDLSASRDLSDVRDIVAGYRLAAIKGKPGETYQLCSGNSVSIKSVLDKLLKLSTADIKVQIDKSRFRKSDIPILKGDCSKSKRQLGWKMHYSLDKTLNDTLLYWRNIIG
nr:GDP-mannose 4,6-dehydratase [candidate division Zixibacteria bacterium]